MMQLEISWTTSRLCYFTSIHAEDLPAQKITNYNCDHTTVSKCFRANLLSSVNTGTQEKNPCSDNKYKIMDSRQQRTIFAFLPFVKSDRPYAVLSLFAL